MRCPTAKNGMWCQIYRNGSVICLYVFCLIRPSPFVMNQFWLLLAAASSPLLSLYFYRHFHQATACHCWCSSIPPHSNTVLHCPQADRWIPMNGQTCRQTDIPSTTQIIKAIFGLGDNRSTHRWYSLSNIKRNGRQNYKQMNRQMKKANKITDWPFGGNSSDVPTVKSQKFTISITIEIRNRKHRP